MIDKIKKSAGLDKINDFECDDVLIEIICDALGCYLDKITEGASSDTPLMRIKLISIVSGILRIFKEELEVIDENNRKTQV